MKIYLELNKSQLKILKSWYEELYDEFGGYTDDEEELYNLILERLEKLPD
jgi:hypothetical protein